MQTTVLNPITFQRLSDDTRLFRLAPFAQELVLNHFTSKVRRLPVGNGEGA